jgi:hypothetical protein
MHRMVWLGVILAALLMGTTTAKAQSVLTSKGNWTSTLTVPPADPGPGGSEGGVAGIHSGVFYDGAVPDNGLTLLGYEATATQTTPDPPLDHFTLQISQQQTFVLAESAFANIPVFLNGTISFAGPAPSFAYGQVRVLVDIFDSSLVPVSVLSVHSPIISSSQPTGALAVDKFFFAETATPLAAGTYTLRATLQIGGEGGSISSPPGAQAIIDFYQTGANIRQGMAVSLGTFKDGLGNSREAVNAPAARTDFGVDGTGVKVGLFEVGLPQTTHTGLPAARLSWVAPTKAGDFNDEHALGTAAVIAAADAATGNAGIAPGASIVAAGSLALTGGFDEGLAKVLAAGVKVISRSAGIDYAGDPVPTTRMDKIDAAINANPLVTWVNSAGNNGTTAGQNVDYDGQAYNIISVGAMNRDFMRRADFSSFSAGNAPIKPDIVAPGQYITTAVAQDINGDTLVNDYHKTFLGDHYYGDTGDPSTGGISGTSFSTPHVAGAAALLNQYAVLPTTVGFDAASTDHRVIKAVLLNGARTTGILHLDGTVWRQGTSSGPAGVLIISQSLDTELGAGMLDVHQALKNYSFGEARADDDNDKALRVIDARERFADKGGFWDLETITTATVGTASKVDYLLGDIELTHLRGTLTWDSRASSVALTDLLDHMEFEVWRDGTDPLNVSGFDPSHPAADVLVAQTDAFSDNVKLIDNVFPLTLSGSGSYYLQVVNYGGFDTLYGLAVTGGVISVPEPSAAVCMEGVTALLFRRRPQKRA